MRRRLVPVVRVFCDLFRQAGSARIDQNHPWAREFLPVRVDLIDIRLRHLCMGSRFV
jgi:hypothetical protein